MLLRVFMDLLRSLSDMGICLCFTWLSHLWSHSIGSSPSQDMASVESLQDDVMTDVLSRLPPDQVVNLRRVCKRWRSLTATPHFGELHLQRSSTPVTIFHALSFDHIASDNFTLYFVDWSSKKKKQLIRKIRTKKLESLLLKGWLQFWGSCNGLFIFFMGGKLPYTYCVVNLITQEHITLKPGLICGFFFNSLTKKYQLLTRDDRNFRFFTDDFRFYIRTLGPPITSREVGSFPYGPRDLSESPSVVNGRLHWMTAEKRSLKNILPPCSHSIMVFSIEDCKFRFLPHPGKVNQSCQDHENMHLLATKGELYAYGMYAKMLDIWVLEDSANWHWVKKFSIHLEQDLKQYSIDDTYIMSYLSYYKMTLIDIWKDEVLLVIPMRGFFRYHMQVKTLTKVQFVHQHCQVIALECKLSVLSPGDFFDSFQVGK